mgnify:CR=1 FL=1
MTEQEYQRAVAYLREEAADLSPIDNVQVGMWALYDDGGNLSLFSAKREAIEDLLSRHMQTYQHCRVRRCRSGRYEVSVLDPGEDRERVWRQYALVRIGPEDLQAIREMALVNLLPDDYW